MGKIDRHGLQRLADHVQVSYLNRSRIYNLRGDKIIAVREIRLDLGAIIDPDNYVQSDGFMSIYRRKNVLMENDTSSLPFLKAEGHEEYSI